MKRSSIVALIVLSVFVGLLPFNTMSVNAGANPYIVVDPVVVYLSPTSKVNDTFTVTIKLLNATAENVPDGVQGVEVKLFFGNITDYAVPVSYSTKVGQTGGVLNPSVLTARDGLYDEYENKTSSPYLGAVMYWVSAASMGDAWYGSEGIIATITFKIVNKPSASEGAFKSTFEILYSELTDANIVSIYPDNINGAFEVLPDPTVFDVNVLGTIYQVVIEGDVAISAGDNLNVNVTAKTISFNVTSNDGYFNVTIPKALMNADLSDWRVFLNQTEATADIAENTTHTSIYVSLDVGFYTVTIKSSWIVYASILLSVSSSSINLGENVTLSGQILGVEGTINVTIHYKKEGGDWSTLAVIQSNSTGHFALDWAPPETGNYSIKASALLEGGSVESGTVNLTVEQSEVEGEGGFDAWLLTIIIGVIVIIVVLLVALLVIRKRKLK
ncbi:MAG: hypothetical protein QXV85_09615 [Candidatus Bathyarchaeia archaeon]